MVLSSDETTDRLVENRVWNPQVSISPVIMLETVWCFAWKREGYLHF
jgi:hypothetical protein